MKIIEKDKKDKKDMEDFFAVYNSPYPSKNLMEWWLVHYSANKYPKHTDKGGKWLIFISKDEVDKVWGFIKKTQDEGLLGDFSKVATAKNYEKFKHHVICVYTYDSTDTVDLLRVRENLNKIGFKDPLHYKRDIETINNVYGTADEFFMTV